MELAIAFMTGMMLLIIGLSFSLRTPDWSAWFDELQRGGRHRILPIASFELILSALMVGLHQVWSGAFMVVTIFWVLGIAEGSLYLLCPGAFKKILGWFLPRGSWLLRTFGIIFTALGLFILYEWWSVTSTT